MSEREEVAKANKISYEKKKYFNYSFSNQNINRLHQISERVLLQTLYGL